MEKQNRKKNKSINRTVRFTQSDIEALEIIAINEGMNISQLMRGAITALQVNKEFRQAAIIYGRDKGGGNVNFN